MNPVIVIPIPKLPTRQFISHLPKGVPVTIVLDTDEEIKFKGQHFQVFTRKQQKQILGKFYAGFKQFQHSSACRNFGHFVALKQGFDVILALDYDCVTPLDFIPSHLAALALKKATSLSSTNGWINPIHHSDWYTRGYPYEHRFKSKTTIRQISSRTVFNMGLWEHVVDINGVDKLLTKPPTQIDLKKPHLIAQNMLPISGMNNAFLSPVTAAYCLLPNVNLAHFTLSRHDDIWGGYILKKLIDLRQDHLSFGSPVVYHSRESFQPRVIHHEHFMHLLNQPFYSLIDLAVSSLKPSSYANMFADLTKNLQILLPQQNLPPHYKQAFGEIIKGMSWWSQLIATL